MSCHHIGKSVDGVLWSVFVRVHEFLLCMRYDGMITLPFLVLLYVFFISNLILVWHR